VRTTLLFIDGPKTTTKIIYIQVYTEQTKVHHIINKLIK